jgi:hypothetical protein
MAKTKERHFEDAIEDHLLTSGGWTKGNPADFDRQTALVAKDLFAFVESTQPETWTELRKHHQSNLEASVLDTLIKALDSRGTLDVLRQPHEQFEHRREPRRGQRWQADEGFGGANDLLLDVSRDDIWGNA